MKSGTFIVRLLFLIAATLIALRILIVMISRVPGVVVALSAIAIVLFAVAYRRRGMQWIGLRSQKASAVAVLASIILFIVSVAILLNVK